MITADNIASHELIGLDTKITASSNSQFIGLNGTIIDETKSMFKISTPLGIKLIPKEINEWKFSIGEHQVTLDGKTIAKRSYDRLGAKA